MKHWIAVDPGLDPSRLRRERNSRRYWCRGRCRTPTEAGDSDAHNNFLAVHRVREMGAPITSDCIRLEQATLFPSRQTAALSGARALIKRTDSLLARPEMGLALNLRPNQYQSTMDAPHRAEHTEVMERHKKGVANEHARVSVVDDDESVRESLPDLLKEFGFEACTFSSAQEFLASGFVNRTGCLILDIAMSGMTGLDLQRELQLRGNRTPIVFITAQTDVAVRARALEQGAVRVLLKPFKDTDLLDAVQAALQTN